MAALDMSGNQVWEYSLNRGNLGYAMVVIEGASSDLYVGGWEYDGTNYYAVAARVLKS